MEFSSFFLSVFTLLTLYRYGKSACNNTHIHTHTHIQIDKIYWTHITYCAYSTLFGIVVTLHILFCAVCMPVVIVVQNKRVHTRLLAAAGPADDEYYYLYIKFVDSMVNFFRLRWRCRHHRLWRELQTNFCILPSVQKKTSATIETQWDKTMATRRRYLYTRVVVMLLCSWWYIWDYVCYASSHCIYF